MRLLIATSNPGKITEVKESLGNLSLDILAPADFGITDSPAETGDTFAANALQKAHWYFEKANVPTLADDSGILVEALQNELGIHTRRWGAGPKATDEEWITYFLERMNREENKQARFVCTLAYIDEHGKEHLFEGTCNGTITETLEANYLPGLPISACFKPAGFNLVYSAMSIADKNSVSHRGKALEQFRTFLESNLGN